jgi:Tol biopolymer transport system component
LFVRQTSANNDITVVPAAKVEYWGITFSKDSENLFYAFRDAGGIAILYRIPALGGTPQKIIEGVDCPVTFSPDGKQMAFVRGEFPNKDESVLIIANADGTGEKVLATRKEPKKFYPNYFTGPSWSPDGKMIAASVVGIGTNLHSKIIGYNVSDGKEIEITKQEWRYIGRVEWLADGKGLVMIAREASGIYRQLWYLSYPNSQARQISNEFKDYRSLSLNADSSKVVTVQTDRMIGVWVAPASDLKQARQILPPISDGGKQFVISRGPYSRDAVLISSEK